jgi:hypothetical protein
MKDNIIPHIRESNTSNETWKTIVSHKKYKPSSVLKKYFFSIRMEENENVYEFLSIIKELRDKFGDIGE